MFQRSVSKQYHTQIKLDEKYFTLESMQKVQDLLSLCNLHGELDNLGDVVLALLQRVLTT